jgi:hypothetical protein
VNYYKWSRTDLQPCYGWQLYSRSSKALRLAAQFWLDGAVFNDFRSFLTFLCKRLPIFIKLRKIRCTLAVD